MTQTQKCPICAAEIEFSARYTKYACADCCKKAVDENDRPLAFYNESFSGGFVAVDAETQEKRASHICYIDKIKCRADEARFGGIVIQTYDEN